MPHYTTVTWKMPTDIQGYHVPLVLCIRCRAMHNILQEATHRVYRKTYPGGNNEPTPTPDV